MKRNKPAINNAGSTFIIVIVAISFMMVLGTIMLAATAANVTSKQIEYAAKQTFYTDERVLDDVYHGIGRVANEQLSLAYTEVLGKASNAGSGAGYTTQQEAYNAFADRFIELIEDSFGAHGLSAANTPLNTPAGYPIDYTDTLNLLRSYVTATTNPSGTQVWVEGFDSIEIVLDPQSPVMTTPPTPDDPDYATNPNLTYGAAGTSSYYHPLKYVFRGVEVRYSLTIDTGSGHVAPDTYNLPNYESVITTDIEIEVPYIHFFQATDSIFDYAVVAVEGLYFGAMGGGSYTQTVTGNVYAGVTTKAQNTLIAPYVHVQDSLLIGGLNVLPGSNTTINSGLLISKGDINVNGGGSLTVQGISGSRADNEIWAESLRIVNGLAPNDTVMNINGFMYIANDLEINGINAGPKKVTLAGSYFGYNEGGYDTHERKQEREATYDSKYAPGNEDNASSSSIIVNGINTTLDLSALDYLVVAGQAYVELRGSSTNATFLEEQVTGESIALKSNQSMYLAPQAWLNYDNPYELSPGEAAPAIGGVWNSSPTEGAFFAEALGLLSADKIIGKEVRDDVTGQRYVYYFLDLGSNLDTYANLILNMKEDYYLNPTGAPAPYATYPSQFWNIKKAIEDRHKGSPPTVPPTGNTIVYDEANTQFYVTGAIAATDGAAPDTLYNLRDVLGANDLYGTGYFEDALSIPVGPGMTPGTLERFYKHLYEYLNPQNGLARMSGAVPNPYVRDLEDNVGAGGDRMPMGEFVDISLLTSSTAPATENPPPYRDSKYITIVKNGNYTMADVDGTMDSSMSGIVIVHGDVTVPNGFSFEGLIMATGNVFVQGSATLTANRSVIQTIVDEELREESKLPAGTAVGTANYAITYLKNIDVLHSGFDATERIDGTDYTSYISYARWRKGSL
ncbi:MAG: hypothetical protein LBI54_03365 [Lachnospiraceae bacterium]|jgi:hypothetical protein|nr:hypothetical protein [Lachnospiraceae bacterium]